MEQFYCHLTNGDDLTVRSSVDPTRPDKEGIFRELERALLKHYGPAARGLKVKGFASCSRRV